MSHLKPILICLLAITLQLELSMAGSKKSKPIAKSVDSCATARNGVCTKVGTRNPSSIRGDDPDPEKCQVDKHIIVNNLFIEAAKNNDLDCVARFTGMETISVNLVGFHEYRGKTPLMVAAQYGRMSVIELLSERDDLDVNKQDRDGKTALFIASEENQIETVRLLTRFSNIDVNKQDKNGNTPIMVAGKNSHYRVVQTLLEHEGIDINKKNNQGLTAYELAKENNHAGVRELFIGHVRAQENELDVRRCFHSAKTGNLGALQTCLAKGADINAQQADGYSLLMLPITYEQPEVFRFLVRDPKTDVNLQDNRGNTALILASRAGTLEDVELLLSREDINIYLRDRSRSRTNVKDRDQRGLTALEYARRRSSSRVGGEDVTSIVQAISGLVAQHKRDLFDAAKIGNIALLERTLDKGIDINVREDSTGRPTPLIVAAQMSQEKIVENLLTRPNVDVNAQTAYGFTALMMATIASNDQIIRLLVSGESENSELLQEQSANIVSNTRNIDLRLKTAGGKTALDIARDKGNRNIISFLEDSSGERGAGAFFRSLFKR